MAKVVVYRCPDAGGTILYTDSPCPGATRITIDPGKTDPAAIAELARARESLERSADARIAEQMRLAARRDDLVWMQGMGGYGAPSAMGATDAGDGSVYTYAGWGGGYGGYGYGGWDGNFSRWGWNGRRDFHRFPFHNNRPAPRPPFHVPNRPSAPSHK